MREGPEAVARQAEKQDARYAELGARLRHTDPHALVTVARGSSDHAALYRIAVARPRMLPAGKGVRRTAS